MKARKQERDGGRPKADDDAKLVSAVERLRVAGTSIRDIAAEFGKSPTTIQKLVKMVA
jgi:transposase